jgi:hypothetical protein
LFETPFKVVGMDRSFGDPIEEGSIKRRGRKLLQPLCAKSRPGRRRKESLMEIKAGIQQ